MKLIKKFTAITILFLSINIFCMENLFNEDDIITQTFLNQLKILNILPFSIYNGYSNYHLKNIWATLKIIFQNQPNSEELLILNEKTFKEYLNYKQKIESKENHHCKRRKITINEETKNIIFTDLHNKFLIMEDHLKKKYPFIQINTKEYVLFLA